MADEVKKEERKVTSVVSKPAEVKKKSGFSKLKGMIISEDAKDVKNYIVADVIIPTIKRTIADVITGGIDMLLFGEVRSRKNRDGAPGSRVSYRKFYDDRDDRYSRDKDRGRLRYEAFDYDNLEFDNRGDAEMVLGALEDIIDQYGTARVGDAYDLAGVTASSYMVNKYGWTSLASARIVRDRDRYYIDFPKAMPID